MKTKLPFQSWMFVFGLWLFCDTVILAQQASSQSKKAAEQTNLYRKNWGAHEAALIKILDEIKIKGVAPYSDYLATRFGVGKRDAKNPAILGIGSKSFGEYLNWLESAHQKQGIGKQKREVYETANRIYNKGLVVDFEFSPGFVLQGRHLFGPNTKDKKRYDVVWLKASDGTVLNGRICRVEGGKNLLPESSDITNMKNAANSLSFKTSIAAYKSPKSNGKPSIGGKSSILIVNNTDRAVSLSNVKLKSPKKNYTAKSFAIQPGKTHKITTTGIDVRSATYRLKTKFGDTLMKSSWSSVGVGDRKIDIGYDDLPIVRRQEHFQLWRSTTGRETKAKFVDQIEKTNGTYLRLLKADGKTVDVSVDKLSAHGKRFSRQINDGSHEFLWQVGTKKIRPSHLVGRDVVFVTYRYLGDRKKLLKNQLDLRKLERAYGPFVEGRVTEANDEFFRLDGTCKYIDVALTGRKLKEHNLDEQKIYVNGHGVEDFSRGLNFSDATIESVIVDGKMYRPVRRNGHPTFFELGQSDFWKTISEGKTPKLTFDKHEKSAAMTRRAIPGLVMMGGFWVTVKALGLKATFESQDCVIEGKTYPNTVVKFGQLVYSEKRRSDARGNYRFVFPSIVKPTAGDRYKLAIEQDGKTVEIWSGELNTSGVNTIDLINQ